MKKESVRIELYNKVERITSTLYVKQLNTNKFKMLDNDIINCQLTLGTEFETSINEEGKHEITRITKKSNYTTRRFLLSNAHTEADYRMLGNELSKRGGFWQIDFGGYATINIPRDFEYDIDQVIKDLDLRLTEVVGE